MSDPPLLDRAVFDGLVDAIGADGARSVIELFIVESQDYLAVIAAAAVDANAGRRDAARRGAHALKSGAGQVGAAAYAAAAEAVEAAAATGGDLAAAIAALIASAAATEPVLREILE